MNEKGLYNQRYKKIKEIGRGSYGKVHLAKDLHYRQKADDDKKKDGDSKQIKYDEEYAKQLKEYVALKKMATTKEEGVHFTSLREIKILREIDYHPNIIKLYDVFYHKDYIVLALEYAPLDLNDLIRNQNYNLNEADIKDIFYQIMSAMDCLHKNYILHRDMKPENMLVTAEGDLKLSDFGLARFYGTPENPMTTRIITRYYKPPEILYGAKFYGPSIDIWSCGCILAELYLRRPLFEGESELDMLARIFRVRGSPNDKNWPDVIALPNYIEFEPVDPIPWESVVPNLSKEAEDLLERMLQLDPEKRITAEDILKHEYFKVEPFKSESIYRSKIKQMAKPI